MGEETYIDSLRIWLDRNSDGKTDADELLTLSSAGIENIDLRTSPMRRTDEYGNRFVLESKVRLKDRSTRPIVDVVFRLTP